MAIRITVSGAGRTSVKLAKLGVNIKGGARSLSVMTVRDIVAIVVIHDTKNFKAMQDQRAENAISVPAAIFSRQNNYINLSSPTILRLEVKVKKLLPLADTRRLWESVTNANSPDFQIKVTADAITINNLVPYAAKHMTGIALVNINVYELYEFGAQEQARLKERVPPPPKGGGGRRNGTNRARGIIKGFKGGGEYDDQIVRGILVNHPVGKQVKNPDTGDRRDDLGDLKSSRPYWRLYNWALNRYPTSGALRKRNWVFPLSPEVTQKISQMVVVDIVKGTGL